MAYGTANVDVIQSSTAGVAPQFNDGNGTQTGTLCRAWVNFNGTSTPSIRASFNVSSITYNSTGNFSINFTNALADANYSTCGSANDVSTPAKARFIGSYSKTTSANSIVVSYVDGSDINATNVEVAIFR